MENRHISFKKLFVYSTVTTLVLAALNVNAFTNQDQVETVGNLLLKSSAARKIDASSNDEVKAIYKQAKDFYLQAKSSTEPAETKRLLDLVVQHMVKAGKIADQGAALGVKWKSDFENRLASIEALLVAQENIAAEKGSNEASKVRQQVKGLVVHAKGQYDKHDYIQGRETLDKAYVQLKSSIENMRGGDTLVNTLVFETPAEEFKYFQTKTDSQLKALSIFKEKSAKASKKRMIDNITKSAKKYINDATILANDGDYEAAIPLMEKALTRLQSGLMMALN